MNGMIARAPLRTYTPGGAPPSPRGTRYWPRARPLALPARFRCAVLRAVVLRADVGQHARDGRGRYVAVAMDCAPLPGTAYSLEGNAPASAISGTCTSKARACRMTTPRRRSGYALLRIKAPPALRTIGTMYNEGLGLVAGSSFPLRLASTTIAPRFSPIFRR
jgi:hypothetical protein